MSEEIKTCENCGNADAWHRCGECHPSRKNWVPKNESDIEVLPGGGKQALEEDEFRYFSPGWLLAMAMGLTAGARKYGTDNWRLIAPDEHAWRAVRHLVLYIVTRDAEHLVNASMRCMMAWETAKGNDTASNDTASYDTASYNTANYDTAR